MKIEELIQLYPTGSISTTASKEKLSLFIDEKYYLIDEEILSESESKLLKHLFPLKEFAVNPDQHPWYLYLFSNQTVDYQGTFRIFHFHIQKPKDFLQSEWQHSLKEIFQNQLDFFFFSENDGVLIEEYNKNHFSLEELQSIFLTLDADFDSSTAVFIGNFFAFDHFSTEIFYEEQMIFKNERKYQKQQTTFSLSDVALHYFTKEAVSKSLIMQHWKQNDVIDQDMQNIIVSLWKNQGNISSAAKDLFMHRNTLHYRLDKFGEQTGLSLKKMDDLLFCYLLLST
ncbi:helix-turn-helix domain-containing protein [Enterococcus sp. LJL99]